PRSERRDQRHGEPEPGEADGLHPRAARGDVEGPTHKLLAGQGDAGEPLEREVEERGPDDGDVDGRGHRSSARRSAWPFRYPARRNEAAIAAYPATPGPSTDGGAPGSSATPLSVAGRTSAMYVPWRASRVDRHEARAPSGVSLGPPAKNADCWDHSTCPRVAP